ncbi:MAG: site-2 protease family protein [Actinobacteria bacterium]|nr:site-2 protease family protein [Actinomycetota bacterium]
MSLVISILGLAFLILVHEAGHFFMARLVGMKPTRFYIGFPPALAKVTRNGIEYGIGAIPLGGYVKIPGMHRMAPSDVDAHLGPALQEAPQLYGPVERLKRALAEDREAEALQAVDELEEAVDHSFVSPGPRRAADRGVREAREALSKHAYWRQRAWKRVIVIFAGPGTNLLFAIILFAALFMAGGGKATFRVASVLPKEPAAVAGLKPGDKILQINGVVLNKPSQIPQRISGSHGHTLRLLVQRNGRFIPLEPVQAHRKDGFYRLGFTLEGKGLSPPEAFWQSIKLTGTVTKQIGVSLGNLVHGQGRKDIASPVGIVQGSSSALKEGLQSYLWVLGLISLSLALLNLLPLLPLDGGHIAFSIVEGIRGRAVKREIYERVSAIGIFLVVLLFFVGLSNDIGRLGGG